jgi:CMP-N,N'-diacetyllegionaminic acid synthase
MSGIVAVVPARGGSKGVPRKNVKPLAGKPLIAWTIEAALAAPCVARVIVSTEDAEIAQVARAWGAAVPFVRPAALASDTATSIDVAMHALDWLCRTERAEPTCVLWLQPTSPLRTSEDIEAARTLQAEKHTPAVVSVCAAAHPPQWLKRIGPHGELLPWQIGVEPERRQDIGPVYQLNGAIYLTETTALRQHRTFAPDGALAYVMPPERSLDIDTPWDFHLAELILQDRYAARA